MAADPRIMRALLFTLLLTPVCGCSDTRLSPGYTPQGLLTDPWPSGAPVNLTVLDRIRNTAPLPSAGVLGIHQADPGAQWICDACGFQFAAPPAELVKRIVREVLVRQGTPVTASATRTVEIQVQQFEFFVSRNTSGRELRLGAKVGIRVIVSSNGGVVVDRYSLEANKFESGPFVSAGEMEEWVSRTASAAVERALTDPKVSAALSRP